jgi:hypothetical protein
MTVEQIKKAIYTITPEDAKDVYSYTSSLITERTHNAIRDKNKHLVVNYTKMVNYIEDAMFIKIISQTRKQEVAFARYCLYNFIKDELNEGETNISKIRPYVTLIADIFNKDHSSIVHGLKTYRNEILFNTELQYIDTQIKAIIKEYKDKVFLTFISPK